MLYLDAASDHHPSNLDTTFYIQNGGREVIGAEKTTSLSFMLETCLLFRFVVDSSQYTNGEIQPLVTGWPVELEK